MEKKWILFHREKNAIMAEGEVLKTNQKPKPPMNSGTLVMEKIHKGVETSLHRIWETLDQAWMTLLEMNKETEVVQITTSHQEESPLGIAYLHSSR